MRRDALRPSHTAAITKTIMNTRQRERILFVELLHAEYALPHATNGMRSLCVVIVIVLVIAAVGPGLYRTEKPDKQPFNKNTKMSKILVKSFA